MPGAAVQPPRDPRAVTCGCLHYGQSIPKVLPKVQVDVAQNVFSRGFSLFLALHGHFWAMLLHSLPSEEHMVVMAQPT